VRRNPVGEKIKQRHAGQQLDRHGPGDALTMLGGHPPKRPQGRRQKPRQDGKGKFAQFQEPGTQIIEGQQLVAHIVQLSGHLQGILMSHDSEPEPHGHQAQNIDAQSPTGPQKLPAGALARQNQPDAAIIGIGRHHLGQIGSKDHP